jgi:hypothetical protein
MLVARLGGCRENVRIRWSNSPILLLAEGQSGFAAGLARGREKFIFISARRSRPVQPLTKHYETSA